MNALIKELAEQAGIVFWEMSGDVDWRQANREHLEKFAELIIRECIRLCDQVDIVGADECIDNIKEQFGIKK